MAANQSENKVRVTKFFGGGGALGVMDPVLHMVTDQGPIIALASGNYTVSVGVGTGDVVRTCYPHQLFVTLDEASGHFAWPTGDGSVRFGRHDVWPSGVPHAVNSGIVYKDGTENGTVTFSRP